MEALEKIINRFVKSFNSRDYNAIIQDFNQKMLKDIPLKKAKELFSSIIDNYGKIEKLFPPRATSKLEAIFPAQFEKIKLDIKITLDNKNQITGLWILPAETNLYVPEKNESQLELPFKEEWFVFWGGDTEELNQHKTVTNQQFAFDFLILDKEKKSYKYQGNKNTDYYAFGKKVLSPGKGIVTEIIDGVRDNNPRSMNPYSALGNTVFIQHNENEVSVIAHLKQNSIKVKVGDKVKVGQVIGLCGNSGNSTEAHIHYHLQNTPIIQDGTGIKCYFQNVKVNKKLKKLHSPVKGEFIAKNKS